MSDDDNRYTDEGVDERLRAAYRHLATETTPPDLDAVILAEARRPVRTERSGLARWRRPLAWVTMIALSFAIVLEFNQTGTLPDAEYTEPAQQDAPAGLAEPSAPDTVTVEDPNVGTGLGFTPFDRDERLEELLEEAAQSEKRARDEELSTMSAPQGAVRTESAERDAEESGKATRGSGRSETVPAGASDGACSAEARNDPARWRDCIGELLARGRSVDARAEFELYRERFPDEPAPDLTQ